MHKHGYSHILPVYLPLRHPPGRCLRINERETQSDATFNMRRRRRRFNAAAGVLWAGRGAALIDVSCVTLCELDMKNPHVGCCGG